MCQRNVFVLGLVLLTVVLLVPGAFGGKYNKAIDVGDKGPAWEQLEGVDGKQHSLGDLKAAKLVVAVFTCNKCPVAVAYEDRLIEFARDYKDKGVALVAINPNGTENLEQMKERAEKKDFNFPYVYDATQDVARGYGATCTPHVFVLDGKRAVAYMGAIDDKLSDPKEHYLRDAVDALLAGDEPDTTETRQFGCSIKWKKQ